jgi:hypothetical protein
MLNQTQFTTSHLIYLRFTLILFSQLRLGLPSGIFHSDFPTKMLYALLAFSMRATCLFHLTLLDLITLIIFGEAYKLWSSSLCSILYQSATFSLLGPNILLSTLFSNTLNLCSSFSVRGQFSHLYKATGKIIILHILTVKLLQRRREYRHEHRPLDLLSFLCVYF